MHTETQRAGRFLDAFHRIEALLAAQLGGDMTSRPTFYELVRRSKQLTDQQKARLRDAADLRNAIVHHPGGWGTAPIADPREDIVSWLETQVAVIDDPPRVLSALKLQPPQVLRWDADLSAFLDEVRKHDFSQSPVRQADGSLALITTNAVARWVASGYDSSYGVALADTRIIDVLGFVEEEDRLIVKPRDFHAVEAARLFAGSVGGEIPAAIVLTQTGNPTQTPLGICVRADVATLLSVLGV